MTGTDAAAPAPDAAAVRLAVAVLGPLTVSAGGRRLAVTSGRLRALLVALALAGGEIVGVDRLAGALWGERLPASVRRALQTYVARLRVLLGAESIVTGSDGYALRIAPDQVDAVRFERLLDAAARAGGPVPERALLVEALALWRGLPFEDLRSAWLTDTVAPGLEERYLTAVERRVDLDLGGGGVDGPATAPAGGQPGGDLAAELSRLIARHPLRESLWVRLLVVLARSGRVAEALERYETVRVRLATELGVDPGPELRQVYADLLALGTAPVGSRPASAPWVLPRQLPAEPDGFTGRAAHLARLDAVLAGAGAGGRGGAAGERGGAVPVAVLHGTAGVGKTALALHWAHRVADRFPDGQLYVNLRGYDPSGASLSVADAVRGFLDALAMPAARIPAGLDAQVAAYRSLVADRRLLVVLDNARSADQVRPLLPGGAGCAVVVTSRDQLTGLVAAGASPLLVDLLSRGESGDLLARRLGRNRLAGAAPAADEIIERCARLPLALALVAARAATHPSFPLGALAAELRDARGGLGAFTGSDAGTDVRAVFSWSYRTLSPPAARLFRLLGLHPGPDAAAPAAASLAGAGVAAVRPLLAELCRAHLLAEHLPGRYTFHDLLRAYAAELVSGDSEADRQAAVRRMVDHYLHTTYAASVRSVPNQAPLDPVPPAAGVTLADLPDYEAVQGWHAAEHPVLLAVQARAAAAGLDAQAWQLGWFLRSMLDRAAHYDDLAAVGRTALAAATRLGAAAGQARAHQVIAMSAIGYRRPVDARAELERALALFERAGDRAGMVRCRLVLALAYARLGRPDDALQCCRRALRLSRDIGYRSGEVSALNGLGWYQTQLGAYGKALFYSRKAFALLLEIGDVREQASVLDTMGIIQHRLGDHREGIRLCQQALAVYRELDEPRYQSDTLVHLGEIQLDAGDRGAARDAWSAAVAILADIDHPDTDELRARLRSLDRELDPTDGLTTAG